MKNKTKKPLSSKTTKINTTETSSLFEDIYQEEIAFSGKTNKTLGSKDYPQICRFCNKEKERAEFNEAHIIPVALNRNNLTCFFECKSCNDKISTYEDSLGKYLLPVRVIYQTLKRKGKGTPTIKFNDGTRIETVHHSNLTSSRFKSNSTELNKIVNFWKREQIDPLHIKLGEDIEIEELSNGLSFTVPIQPYNKFNIFRTFIHIALCLIPEKDIEKYTYLRGILYHKDLINELTGTEFKLIEFTLPMMQDVFKNPIVVLYRRRKQFNSEYPERVLVFSFLDKIFQIPIYSNDDKKKMELDSSLSLPLLNFNVSNKVLVEYLKQLGKTKIVGEYKDMSTTTDITDDKAQITITGNSIFFE